MVAATLRWNTQIATKLKKAAKSHRLPRRQRAGGDDGRDGIGAVVKAVHEIEGERDGDRAGPASRALMVRCSIVPQEFSIRISSMVLAASSQ